MSDVSESVGTGNGSVTRQTGLVKFFNSKKGYGFITPDDGTRDVFIPMNNVPSALLPLRPNDHLSYVKVDGDRGPFARDLARV